MGWRKQCFISDSRELGRRREAEAKEGKKGGRERGQKKERKKEKNSHLAHACPNQVRGQTTGLSFRPWFFCQRQEALSPGMVQTLGWVRLQAGGGADTKGLCGVYGVRAQPLAPVRLGSNPHSAPSRLCDPGFGLSFSPTKQEPARCPGRAASRHLEATARTRFLSIFAGSSQSDSPHSLRQDESHTPGCYPTSHPNRKQGLPSL